MSTCCMCWCKDRSSATVMAALLSQRMVIGGDSEVLKPISQRSILSQIASFAALNTDMYSASQDDEATVLCFLHAHEITPDPSENA